MTFLWELPISIIWVIYKKPFGPQKSLLFATPLVLCLLFSYYLDSLVQMSLILYKHRNLNEDYKINTGKICVANFIPPSKMKAFLLETFPD